MYESQVPWLTRRSKEQLGKRTSHCPIRVRLPNTPCVCVCVWFSVHTHFVCKHVHMCIISIRTSHWPLRVRLPNTPFVCVCVWFSVHTHFRCKHVHICTINLGTSYWPIRYEPLIKTFPLAQHLFSACSDIPKYVYILKNVNICICAQPIDIRCKHVHMRTIKLGTSPWPKRFRLPNTSFLCHCNTQQHTATHCNTQQHTATHSNALQHTSTHLSF